MADTGLPVFDKTLQTTHIWLNEIMEELGPDRALAWKSLSVGRLCSGSAIRHISALASLRLRLSGSFLLTWRAPRR